jgi:uncharacterized protein YegP (UPF0339 family)
MVITYFLYEQPKGQWHWYIMKHKPGAKVPEEGGQRIAQSVTSYASEEECRADIRLIRNTPEAVMGELVTHAPA